MKRSFYFSIILLVFSYLPQLQAEDAKVGLGAPQSGVRAEMIDITAKVADIDYSTRHVTLEDPNGGTLTFRVDDIVKNLNKVKKGDKVAMQYQKTVSWKLLQGKVTPTKTVSKSTTTKPGTKKPEVTRVSETNIIATIKNIDKSVPAVTLQGPDGVPFTVKLRNPAVLEGVKVGDQVDLTYTESIAVKVQKVKG